MIDMKKELEKVQLQYEGLLLEYNYIKELKNADIEEKNVLIRNLEHELHEQYKKYKNKLLEMENTITKITIEKATAMAKMREENEITIMQMHKEINDLKNAYENSTSWKITKPLRSLKIVLNSFKKKKL